MKSAENTYKNTATEKQLTLICEIERESAELITRVEKIIDSASKNTRLTHTGPQMIVHLKNALDNNHYDPHSWIVAVRAQKQMLENILCRELEMDKLRSQPIYSV